MSETEVIVTRIDSALQWNFRTVEEASEFLLGRVPFDGPVYRIWVYLSPEALDVHNRLAQAQAQASTHPTSNPRSGTGGPMPLWRRS